MANIVLKTFAAGDEGQGTVTPQDDALIYQNAVSVNGIFGGATVTLTGANTLHVASGFGIICGRFFEINESDISVQLSSSGTLSGRLKIHLDLNNADNPIEIVTETGATLPALSGDSNININGGAFDMELCTFSVNELTISSLVNTFPTIDNTSKQVRRNTAYAVNDFVLCQSASDALIFICTTAGTTSVQEPTAYTTVTDGNTVTDGTAVFKAVSVSGQIEKLSKTEVLISIVENGNTCTHTGGISAGQYVNWKGDLYTADTNIAVGTTFASSGGGKNLTVVSNGGLNKLNDDKYDALNVLSIANIQSIGSGSAGYIANIDSIFSGIPNNNKAYLGLIFRTNDATSGIIIIYKTREMVIPFSITSGQTFNIVALNF